MAPTDAGWIVPHANASTLFVSVEGPAGYRTAREPIQAVASVPMPLRSEHVLDLAADLLVYAGEGEIVTVGSLRGGGSPEVTRRIPLPPGFQARTLTLRGGVVFAGGGGGGEVLGLVDLHGDARFRPVPLELDPRAVYTGVERLVLDECRLMVLGDVPRHVLNVADPRAPRVAEAHPGRPTGLRPLAVAATSRFVARLLGRPIPGLHIVDLGRRGGIQFFPRTVDPVVDAVRSVAAIEDILLIAAGPLGLGVASLVDMAAPVPAPLSGHGRVMFMPSMVPGLGARLVAVDGAKVVGAVPVDGTRAFAVTEDERGLDSVIVRIG